jgi:hypothetical protein
MCSKLPVQKKHTASSAKHDDVVPTSTSNPFVFQDQDTVVPDPPVVTKVVLAPHSPSKHLKLKQHKRSPMSGTKVEACSTKKYKKEAASPIAKLSAASVANTTVTDPLALTEVVIASGNAVAVKTEGIVKMETCSSARGKKVCDTEDAVVKETHSTKTSTKPKMTISAKVDDMVVKETHGTNMVVKETRGKKTSTEPKMTISAKVDEMVPSKVINKPAQRWMTWWWRKLVVPRLLPKPKQQLVGRWMTWCHPN